jgi:5-methylcytosine-specific restriction endonuclease McrA
MRRRLSNAIRDLVAQRARYRCEYCLIRAEDTFYGCQVEHIISLKHGGSNHLEAV